VPASFCGVVGLKPSFGRVAMYPNARTERLTVTAGFETLEAIGPLTRTVGDAALTLGVIAGSHPLDRHSFTGDDAPSLAPGPADLRGLRVGLASDLGDGAPVDPTVRRAVEDVADELASLGATVEEDGPRFRDPARTFLAIVALELGSFRAFVAEHRADIGERVRSIVAEAWTFEDVSEALRGRRAMVAEMGRFFERQDVLLTPTTPAPPFPVERPYPETIDGRAVGSAYVMGGFTAPFNLTGHPAVSVPVAWTDGGLPIGAQLVGPHLRDEVVLRLARALEDSRPWRDIPAPVEHP
jgi:aspartyl-tRNA(Asn)/glutamyl-tRNA(Gln) amidotransferase subunit A